MRGDRNSAACDRCASTDAVRPFEHCVSVRQLFNGACGNCLWRHRGHECSHSSVYGSGPAVGAGLSTRTQIPQTPGGRPGTRSRSRAAESSDRHDAPPDARVPQISLRRTPSRRDPISRDPWPVATVMGGSGSLATPPPATTDDSSGRDNGRVLSTAPARVSRSNAAERGGLSTHPPVGGRSSARRTRNLPGHVPLSDVERRQLDLQVGNGSGSGSSLSSARSLGSRMPSPVVDEAAERRTAELEAEHVRAQLLNAQLQREDEDERALLESTGGHRGGRLLPPRRSSRTTRGRRGRW